MAKRPYRGKFPTRIRQVEGLRTVAGTYLVTTNDGQKFYVLASENRLRDMPDLGVDIAQFVSHAQSDPAALLGDKGAICERN